jgi:hypothetical protein
MASTSLVKIREQLKTLRERHSKSLDHAKRGFKVAGDALVVNAASTFTGYLQGRYGGKKLLDTVPYELLLAAGFYGVGVFGPKSAAHQFYNLGHGTTAAYTSALGRGFGRQQRAKSGGKPLIQGLSDSLDELTGEPEGGGALSTEDLIAMANRI